MSYNTEWRSEWGARNPTKHVPIAPKKIKSVVIHYIGAPIGYPEDDHQRVRSTQDYHMDVRGWSDIAYNYLVDQSGRVYVGRGDTRRNAANRPSKGNISICALLGTTHVTPSTEMIDTIQRLIWDLKDKFPGIRKIKPHKALKSTSCPGPMLTKYIKEGYFTVDRPPQYAVSEDVQEVGALLAAIEAAIERSKELQVDKVEAAIAKTRSKRDHLPSWTALTRKRYATDPATVERVEGYRPLVRHCLEAKGLGHQLDQALAVMACESGGIAVNEDDGHDVGLYQFIPSTWKSVSDLPVQFRTDPRASCEAMAELVSRRGWQDWAGGVIDGKKWGSGPAGFGCWRYQDDMDDG